MLIVLDTNILISGLLWMRLSHRLIELGEAGSITICATGEILEELQEVLARPKFRRMIWVGKSSVEEIMLGVISLVALCPSPPTVRAVPADPDDDIFIACALNAGAKYIVSDDDHLLQLREYRGIKILMVKEFLEWEFPASLQ